MAVWVTAAAVLLGVSRASWMVIFFFGIFPLLWSLSLTRRGGILASAVFSLGTVVAITSWPRSDLGDGLVNGGLSFLFSLAMGMWFWRVYTVATVLASALSNERAARETLARARGELAAAKWAAGRTAEHQRWASGVHDTLAQGFISVITLAQVTRAELERGERDGDGLGAPRADGGAGPRQSRRGEGARRRGGAERPEDRRPRSGPRSTGPVPLREQPARDARLRPAWRAPAARRVVVLRTVQEALSNVARHARATCARVTVGTEQPGGERELVVTVTDDGIGAHGAPEGTGLSGMRTRVESVGGTLTVDLAGAPDVHGRTGTVVEARMPL